MRQETLEERRARQKSAKRLSLHGLDDDDVDHIVATRQQGRCPICKRPYGDTPLTAPAIDHAHNEGESRNSGRGRGRLRDIICGACNRMLGLAYDNPATLRRAANYLTKHMAKLRRHDQMRSDKHILKATPK